MPNPDNNQNNESQNTPADANNGAQNANQNGDANTEPTQQPQPQYVTMEDFNQMRGAMDSLTDTMKEIMGGIKAIKDAQGVMVRAGATIIDDSDPEPVDDFKPLSELDFSVKR